MATTGLCDTHMRAHTHNAATLFSPYSVSHNQHSNNGSGVFSCREQHCCTATLRQQQNPPPSSHLDLITTKIIAERIRLVQAQKGSCGMTSQKVARQERCSDFSVFTDKMQTGSPWSVNAKPQIF